MQIRHDLDESGSLECQFYKEGMRLMFRQAK